MRKHLRFKVDFWKISIVVFVSFFFVMLNSCTSIDCRRCDNENEVQSEQVNMIRPDRIFWIEFNNDYPKYSKLKKDTVFTLISCTVPIYKKNNDGTAVLTITEIDSYSKLEIAEPWRKYNELKEYSELTYNEKTQYYRDKYTLEIHIGDRSEIKYIGTSSDVDIPPKLINPESIITNLCECCIRDRECIGEKTIFDKVEIRAMAGYRFNANDEILYDGPFGGVTYPKETLGFDRGGTDFTIGLESAFLWDITPALNKVINIPRRNKFHLGPMIGLWPVDEAFFIPVSLHPRYTFAWDETDRMKDECNAWYIFGDLGVPIDPTFKVPIMCEGGNCSDLFAYFYGLGIGRDWWMNKCMDFSIDLGFRVSNTPLPENLDCVECTQLDNKYPFRKISQVFIRFGFTW